MKKAFTLTQAIVLGCLLMVTMLGCKNSKLDDNWNFEQALLGGTISNVPFEPYQAPSEVKETYRSPGLLISYSAEVSIPNVKAFSIYKIAKAVLKADYYLSVMDYFEPGETWSVLLPTQDDNTNSRSTFLFDSYQSGDQFKLFCNNRNGSTSVLKGEIDGNSMLYIRDPSAVVMREDYLQYDDSLADLFKEPPKLTEKEALKIAESTLQNIGLDSTMKISDIDQAIAFKNQKLVTSGWFFVYMRYNSDLPSYYLDYSTLWENSLPPTNVSPWGQESLFIFVDSNGVYCFDMRNAGTQRECIVGNVSLLSFNELLKKINKRMVVQHKLEEDGIENCKVEVKRIRLCNALVAIENNDDWGVSIPVWQITYYFSYDFDGTHVPEEEQTTYLNALDGSYIEPRINLEELANIYSPVRTSEPSD
jgi:hypothetical protein